MSVFFFQKLLPPLYLILYLYFDKVAASKQLFYTFSDLSMIGIAVPRLSVRSPSRKRSLPTTTSTNDRCK